MCGATKRRHRNHAFVKLLETVSGPLRPGVIFGGRVRMKQEKARTMMVRTGVLVLAGALLWPLAASAQSPGDGVSNFLNNLFAPKSGGDAQQPQAAGPGGAPPWSGEDGASGHPLMTASAIREAAANFNNCVAGMWPDAARRGISQESFQKFTAGLSPDLRIMDLMDSQPEFTKAVWDYLDILVNDNRMAKGREILAKYKPQFDAV